MLSGRGRRCARQGAAPAVHVASNLLPTTLPRFSRRASSLPFFFFFSFFRVFDKPCGVSEHSSSALAGLVAQLLVQGQPIDSPATPHSVRVL